MRGRCGGEGQLVMEDRRGVEGNRFSNKVEGTSDLIFNTVR